MYTDIMNYIKSIQETNPVLSTILGLCLYLMFPEQSYMTSAIAVLIAIVLDLITKYYSMAKMNGGLRNAFRKKVIDSDKMLKGTSTKLFTYLILFILAGLSYRVTPITGASLAISTVVYLMSFFKETQSILRNLQDAGSDVGWALSIVSKKQKIILEDEGVNEDELDN